MTISILLPIYNGNEFIDECLSSIINQTHKDWELLIGINGQSIPEAHEAISKIRAYNDPRIKIFRLSKRGKVITLRSLCKIANGKIICLIDIDDKWIDTKLEEQLPYMKKYDAVASDVEYFGEAEGSPRLVLGKVDIKTFGYQNPIINSMVMMKRTDAYWEDHWEGIDDLHLWLHLLKQNKTFYNVPKMLGYHRIHKDSYFNRKNDKVGQKLRKTIPELTYEEKYEFDLMIENKDWKE